MKKLCVVCGTSFPFNRSQGKTCSERCHKILVHSIVTRPKPSIRGNNNPIRKSPSGREKIRLSKIGKKNPNWKPKVFLPCKICGKMTPVIPSYAKSHNYRSCSRKCSSELIRIRMKMQNPMKRPNVAQIVSIKLKECWKDKHLRKNWLSSRSRHPNQLEIDFEKFIQNYNIPFEFVGDWKFWIGPCKSGKCRNPDFVHVKHGLKLAILVSGRFHHTRYPKQMVSELEDYASVGWRVLNIWEDEFREHEEQVLRRIVNWVGLVFYIR